MPGDTQSLAEIDGDADKAVAPESGDGAPAALIAEDDGVSSLLIIEIGLAAIAALASEIVAVSMFTFLLNRNGIRLPRRLAADVMASLSACALMVAALRAADRWSLASQIALGAGVYGVTLLVFRFLDKDEVRTARLMLRASASGV